MVQRKAIPAYLYMPLATLCWGVSFISIKIALEVYTPITIVTVRLFFVALILGAVFLFAHKKNPVPRGKDLLLLVFLGFLNPFLSFLLETTSMLYVSASMASIMMSTVHLITPLAAFLLLKEKVRIFNIVGLFISFAGLCLIIFYRGAEAEYTPLGLILIICTVLAGVLYTIVAKKLLDRYSSLTIVTFQQVFGFLMYIPLFFFTGNGAGFFGQPFHATGFLNILFLAVFPSTIAYYLFNDGIKKIGPTRANAYINLVPVITAIASYFILKESVGIVKALGIIIVITGLFLSQKKKRMPVPVK